jgi:hypothetical protein
VSAHGESLPELGVWGEKSGNKHVSGDAHAARARFLPPVVQLSQQYAIDGADRYSGGYGRLVNCCRPANVKAGHARGNNLAFAVDHRRKRVHLVAKRKIVAGEELFVSYGPAYKWNT